MKKKMAKVLLPQIELQRGKKRERDNLIHLEEVDSEQTENKTASKFNTLR